MSLHLLVGIAALLSAVEESTAATSITLLDCGGIKFQHELYTHSELPAAIEDTDLTFLVPWLDAGQVRKMELNDFGNGAYVRNGHGSTDMTEVMLGWVLSHGSSQVYVPSVGEHPGGFSRLFFENYLLNTARRYRLIVLSLPEDSHMSMSNDSLNSLMRLMSLPSESLEVNLVAVGEETKTTLRFYDTDHHSNYIRNVIKSCRECSLVTVKRWVVTEEEAGKNFPSIPYEISGFGDTLPSFQQEKSHKVQNLRTITCMKMTQAGESMFSPFRSNGNLRMEPPFDSIGGVFPVVPVVPDDDIFRKGHVKEDIFADLLIHQLLPVDHHSGSSLFRLMDELAPLGKTKNAQLRKRGEAPMILYEPTEKCKGNLLVIVGDYFFLEIDGKGCDYDTVLVRASVGIQITENIVLPGKSLIIYAPEVSSFGDHVIDLTGKECNSHYSGNFNLLAKKFYGLPLKVKTNGGKDCGSEIEQEKKDFNTLWTISENGEVSFGSSWRSNQMKETGPGRRSFPKKNHLGQPKTTMGKLKNIELDKGFASSLSRRDLIQIFAGHVINDNSMDGKKIVQQAQILNNLGWPIGGGPSRRIFDPLQEHIPFNPPPFLGPTDLGNVQFGLHRKTENPEDLCFAVQIDGYEIDCAIDFKTARPNEESVILADRLRDHSVAIDECHQVNIPFVTEYDLFACNLTVVDLNLERTLIQMDDGLTCYYDTLLERKTLSCRFPRNVTDGDSLTSHVVDIAQAVLSIRHMAYNPLDMTRISLTNYNQSTTNSDLFADMIHAFNETHKFISRDLDNYYEDSLVLKAIALFNEFHAAVGGDTPYPQDAEISDMICWAGLIRSKILGPPPMSNIYPLMFEELVFGNTDSAYFDFIRKQLVNEIFLNFDAFSLYLEYLKVKTAYYPSEVKEPLSKVLERYMEYTRNQTAGNNFRNSMVRVNDDEKIKLAEELEDTMGHFAEEVIAIEARLEGQILAYFHRTIGNFVRQQEEMLSVFRTTSSILVNETELDFFLRYPLEFIYKIGSECKSFTLDLMLKKSFVEAKMKPSWYRNELYAAILENLDMQRKVLDGLSSLSNFTGGMKAHIETALYLEREVYKSLQSMARANDIQKNIERVKNFKGEHESLKPDLESMYDTMNWALADLIFKSALIDFQQRIFPYWEDMSGLFHPESVAQSLKELSKSEEDYLTKFKHIPFNPKNDSAPVLPYFTWHVNEIGKKHLHDFFRGYPLFLLAKIDGEYPYPLKGTKFALRFIPKATYSGDWLKRTRGTEIHVRPQSFAYNYCPGKTYFTTARSPRFTQTLGVDSRGVADIPVSPYTLWRLRISKIRVDFPDSEVEQIQLVGETYAYDSVPDPPEYPPSWEPRETYEDVLFTLPGPTPGK